MELETKAADVETVLAWLSSRREAHPFSVQPTPLGDLAGWSFDDGGNFGHETGRFFTIRGLRVALDYPEPRAWTQPIIDQPEQGLVGFLLRHAAHGVEVLAHAKMEPGNFGLVQLSPTLQATYSNYTRAHQGRSPAYLEQFQHAPPEQVLSKALLSEQGDWFLQKRNYNMIVEVAEDADFPIYDDYKWLPLRVLFDVMRTHHIIHADSRSVLASIPASILAQTHTSTEFGRAVHRTLVHNRTNDAHERDAYAADRLLTLRAEHPNRSGLVPLGELADWIFDGAVIRHSSRPDFEVVGVQVQAESREVTGWSQPLVSPRHQDMLVLLCRRVADEVHCLVRFQAQGGGASAVEIGPTIHTHINELHDELVALGSAEYTVLCDVMLSDEGGRFYHSMSRHIIAELGPAVDLAPSDEHAWVTLQQMKLFIDSGDASIELRSLFVCLLAS